MKVIRNMPPSLTMEQLRRACTRGVTVRTTITTGHAITPSTFIRCFTTGRWNGAASRARSTPGKSVPTSPWRWRCRAQAINLEKTVARKTPVGDNPAFAFRTFLLRLGLIGPEYKNVRMHLLKRLPGDPAWLRDRNQYESYQRRHTRGGDAR